MKARSSLLRLLVVAVCLFGSLGVLNGFVTAQAPPPVNPQSGSVGLQGAITAPPPTVGATISVPTNGQSFTTLPITVAGICPTGLLVKLYKNNVFAGSAECKNGSFSIVSDLFNGQNDLIARVYDALDQAGPDSNKVTVNFNDAKTHPGARISLTSVYAKRGADPKKDLTWPVDLSGGTAPYAISVDWGDGKSPDLISKDAPGSLSLKHQYDSPGVYNIIVKATDKNGDVAFLQLVGVANGAAAQDNTKSAGGTTVVNRTVIIWWPAVVLLPLIFVAFWLGSRSAISSLKKRLARGEPAFK